MTLDEVKKYVRDNHVTDCALLGALMRRLSELGIKGDRAAMIASEELNKIRERKQYTIWS